MALLYLDYLTVHVLCWCSNLRMILLDLGLAFYQQRYKVVQNNRVLLCKVYNWNSGSLATLMPNKYLVEHWKMWQTIGNIASSHLHNPISSSSILQTADLYFFTIWLKVHFERLKAVVMAKICYCLQDRYVCTALSTLTYVSLEINAVPSAVLS